MDVKTLPGLTGNQLKLIAMAAMTCDHIGLELLPQWSLLRIIGRLALPVFGYMIAEGCRHTRSPKRYLLRLEALALLCQIVYYFAMDSLYQSILVTFFLSACLIFAWDNWQRNPGTGSGLTLGAALFTLGLVTLWLPRAVPGFAIDYGLWGVLLPVGVYLPKRRQTRLWLCGGCLVALALDYGGLQWFGLLALPLLAAYNGQRGKWRIGRLFYIYYPAHLAAIHLLSQFV